MKSIGIGRFGLAVVLALLILAARPALQAASEESEPERNAEISLILIQRYIDDPDTHRDHLKKILGDPDVLNYGYAQALTLSKASMMAGAERTNRLWMSRATLRFFSFWINWCGMVPTSTTTLTRKRSPLSLNTANSIRRRPSWAGR